MFHVFVIIIYFIRADLFVCLFPKTQDEHWTTWKNVLIKSNKINDHHIHIYCLYSSAFFFSFFSAIFLRYCSFVRHIFQIVIVFWDFDGEWSVLLATLQPLPFCSFNHYWLYPCLFATLLALFVIRDSLSFYSLLSDFIELPFEYWHILIVPLNLNEM